MKGCVNIKTNIAFQDVTPDFHLTPAFHDPSFPQCQRNNGCTDEQEIRVGNRGEGNDSFFLGRGNLFFDKVPFNG